VDEVIADVLPEHLRRYNSTFGAALSAEDVRGRHIVDCVSAVHREAALAMVEEML
jgi:hypothetical protein